MLTMPNIALLTECRLLSDSLAINMSLLRSEEQEETTIRSHLRHSPALRDFLMESFDRFQLADLALICLKNETKADAERDLRDLTSAVGADVAEKARRERLLRHLESADKAHPLELAKYSLERARASSSEIDIRQDIAEFIPFRIRNLSLDS